MAIVFCRHQGEYWGHLAEITGRFEGDVNQFCTLEDQLCRWGLGLLLHGGYGHQAHPFFGWVGKELLAILGNYEVRPVSSIQ